MGKMILTPKQQIIFDEAKHSDFIKQNFYFTGETAKYKMRNFGK